VNFVPFLNQTALSRGKLMTGRLHVAGESHSGEKVCSFQATGQTVHGKLEVKARKDRRTKSPKSADRQTILET
jgi:hypothetical protein